MRLFAGVAATAALLCQAVVPSDLYDDSGSDVVFPVEADPHATNLWPTALAPGDTPGEIGPEYITCLTPGLNVSQCQGACISKANLDFQFR